MAAQKRGLFITFEGGDGVGKSTQIRLLKLALSKLRKKVVVSREPGGTRAGEVLRRIHKQFHIHPRCELLVLEASRAEHVEKILRPQLTRGAIILCDRYEESSLVYQGMVRGLGIELVRNANELATGGLKADLIILLDPKELDRSRLKSKHKKDRFDHATDRFHREVFAGYRRLASQDRRFKVYSANLTKQEIHRMILRDVLKVMRQRKMVK